MHAELAIAGQTRQTEVKPQDIRARLDTDLKPGPAMLRTWHTQEDGERHPPYFLWVTRLGYPRLGIRTSWQEGGRRVRERWHQSRPRR